MIHWPVGRANDPAPGAAENHEGTARSLHSAALTAFDAQFHLVADVNDRGAAEPGCIVVGRGNVDLMSPQCPKILYGTRTPPPRSIFLRIITLFLTAYAFGVKISLWVVLAP